MSSVPVIIEPDPADPEGVAAAVARAVLAAASGRPVRSTRAEPAVRRAGYIVECLLEARAEAPGRAPGGGR